MADNNINNYTDYSWFKEQKNELVKMLHESSEVIDSLSMAQFARNLADIGHKVNNDTFKIQVVGDFKNGKSTFINALLGEDILPAYAVPCTAVINEVKYGEEKRAVLHFLDPLPERIPEGMAQRALDHMAKHKGGPVPPMEIPYDEIEDYVVIPMGVEMEEMLLTSPYAKVELFYPCPLLKEGVEIIDSPGLNEAEARTRMTLDYLTKADAILFLLVADKLLSAAEMDFLRKQLKPMGFTDPFFVVNHWDLIKSPREQAMVKSLTDKKLRDAGFDTKRIFYLSGLQGLKAKEASDEAAYAASGVKTFEDTLQHFLTTEKGKLKLTQPARELSNILTAEALNKVIPNARKMLSMSLNSLQDRYAVAEPQLHNLELQKSVLSEKINTRIANTRFEVNRLLLQNMDKIADLIPTWVEECEPTTELGLFSGDEDYAAVTTEICNYVKSKIEEEQIEWQSAVLTEFLKQRTSYVFDDMEGEIANLFDEIDRVTFEISGIGEYKRNDVPTWERVGAAVGGFFVAGAGAGMAGAQNGFSKELAVTIGLQIGGMVVLGLMGIFNPVFLLALALGGGWWSAIRGAKNRLNKLKELIVEKFNDTMAADSKEKAAASTDEIIAGFNARAAKIIEAIELQIADARTQVETILTQIRQGNAMVEESKQKLSANETKVVSLVDRLNSFVIDLANKH